MTPTTITLNGRTYAVEKTTDPLNAKASGYRFTGKRGAIYHTMRNQLNPHLMFLINDRKAKVVDGIWVTDKGGVLKQVKVW